MLKMSLTNKPTVRLISLLQLMSRLCGTTVVWNTAEQQAAVQRRFHRIFGLMRDVRLYEHTQTRVSPLLDERKGNCFHISATQTTHQPVRLLGDSTPGST